MAFHTVWLRPASQRPSCDKRVARSGWRQPWLRAWAFVLGGLLTSLLSGCDTHWRWNEEVVLTSGEHLTLKRSELFRVESQPGNPFKLGPVPAFTTLEVTGGPKSLVGARFEAPMDSLLIDRRTSSEPLILITVPNTCYIYKQYRPDVGWRYLAFELKGNGPAQQVALPDWVWGKQRNLLLVEPHAEPPKTVTPQFADEFNRTKVRAVQGYLEVLRKNPFNCER